MHASAQATAATGGAGNMIQAMPEFVLPFLIFILSHHPDYPSVEVQTVSITDTPNVFDVVRLCIPVWSMLAHSS